MTRKTLTVGIPAFNEGDNIKKLITSILTQKTKLFELEKILISSDGSTDETVKNVSKIKDKRVVVIDNTDRQGIARGLNQITQNSKSDILVTLDADIRILNRNFLNKLISPIINYQADLTSSSIKQIFPETYMARVLETSMQLKSILFRIFKNGNNVYNCYGLARAYSRKFYTKLNFPTSIGNDMYCYLKAIKDGFKFIYVPEAKVYYKLPDNWQDHQKQSERFFITEQKMTDLFDRTLVTNEIRIPLMVYLTATIRALPLLVKHPVYSLIYFFIQLILRIKPKNDTSKQQAWNIVISSKKL